MSKLVDKDRLEWLSGELTELCGTGVIDEAIRRKILENYSPGSLETEVRAQPQPHIPEKPGEAQSFSKSGEQNYFMLVLVLLGALLVGGGVVMLFAYNWESLSRIQRISVAFISVLIGATSGVYTIVNDKDARWQEFSAFMTATGFAVMTAVISQMYNIDVTMIEFCQLVMAVSLPLVYIFRSQLLSGIYCLGLFAFYGYSDYERYYGLCYLAGIAPFILYYLFFVKQRGFRTVSMRYISFLPMLFLVFFNYVVLNFSVIASMLYAVGLHYKDSGERGWKNPWLSVGWILLTVLLVLSVSTSRFFLWWPTFPNWDEHSLGIVFWVFLFALYIYISGSRLTLLKLVVILSPLFHLLCLGMANYSMFILITNLYFFLVSVAALAYGIKTRGLFEVNVGMFQLFLLIMMRFFDYRISILLRSFAFIITGMAFIAANIYLSHRLKKEKSPIAVEVVSGNAEK